MNPKSSQFKELCFESASVDTTNSSCRTVLRARGIISQEKLEAGHDSRDVLDEKDRIGRELACAWAKAPMEG